MRANNIIFSIFYSDRSCIRYYLSENGARFMQLDTSGLERLDSLLPLGYADYDRENRPKVSGVDMV